MANWLQEQNQMCLLLKTELVLQKKLILLFPCFILSLARSSSLSGKISKVVKALTTPKTEMKNDLVMDLSSPFGLRAQSKTNPNEALAPGGERGGVTSQGGPVGARTPRICSQHFQSISAVFGCFGRLVRLHGSTWGNLWDCFFGLCFQRRESLRV